MRPIVKQARIPTGAKKSDFIKKLTKKQITNYLEIIISQVGEIDLDAEIQEMDTFEGRRDVYDIILKNTFKDKSKLGIFLLIFFDTLDLEKLRTKLITQKRPLQVALLNGERKLNMKLYDTPIDLTTFTIIKK